MVSSRRKTLVAVCLLVLVAVVWVWTTRRPRTVQAYQPEATSNQDVTAKSQTTGPNVGTKIKQALGVATSKAERMQEGLSTLNNPDIEFYGKLEDQFGKPLANRQIDFNIQYNDGYSAGVKNGQTSSDSDGYFRITGYRGKSLSITPHIPGY